MYSILIVEDNSTFRACLRGVLKERFPLIGIVEASNGDDALSKIKEIEPILIFTAIKLSGRNGLELTRTIKSIYSEIEVVVLTDYDNLEYREAAFRNGASHFLTKGNAGIDDITAVVASVVANQAQ
ncbi:MAG: response regulator transcription factor [Syntrophobacteraceae bacterium]